MSVLDDASVSIGPEGVTVELISALDHSSSGITGGGASGLAGISNPPVIIDPI